MTKLQARFLRATPADAGVLAELVQLASEGLGLHLWTKLATGGDPWSVGRARLSSETAGLSMGLETDQHRFGALAQGRRAYRRAVRVGVLTISGTLGLKNGAAQKTRPPTRAAWHASASVI